MWDTAKAGLAGKFTAVTTHIQNERANLNDLRKLEREEQIKSKVSRRKEITKPEQKSTKLKTENQ